MYMASTDEIYLTFTGKGGHAAMPAEYNNPILIASEILLELSKEFPNTPDQKIPTVLAFGKVQANGATNVVPDTVKIEGTFRTMNEKWRMEAHEKISAIVKQIAEKRNAKADLNILIGYPFLVNDETVTKKVRAAAEELCGRENVHDLSLRMTAEDFAFISQAVPSCFFRLGTGNKKAGITAGVHNAHFNVDENAIATGAAILASGALNLLK
jgi:amidohydrolase